MYGCVDEHPRAIARAEVAHVQRAVAQNESRVDGREILIVREREIAGAAAHGELGLLHADVRLTSPCSSSIAMRARGSCRLAVKSSVLDDDLRRAASAFDGRAARRAEGVELGANGRAAGGARGALASVGVGAAAAMRAEREVPPR